MQRSKLYPSHLSSLWGWSPVRVIHVDSAMAGLRPLFTPNSGHDAAVLQTTRRATSGSGGGGKTRFARMSHWSFPFAVGVCRAATRRQTFVEFRIARLRYPHRCRRLIVHLTIVTVHFARLAALCDTDPRSMLSKSKKPRLLMTIASISSDSAYSTKEHAGLLSW